MGFSDQQGTGSPRGIMILKPEHRERRVGDRIDGFALFNITQSGCQIRIYPELDANGEALPIRTGRELRDVGLWVCGDHYGIRYLGGNDPCKEKVTMLLTIRGDEKCADPSQRRGLRVWDQLRNTLYHRLDSGTAPQHWSRYIANNREATFGPSSKSKAKPIAMVRGMLTHYVGGEGRAIRNISAQSPKLNCVLMAASNAQGALIELTMTELESSRNYAGDDFSQVFRYENKLVHPQTGCLINFGRKGTTDPRVAQQARAPSPVNFGSATGAPTADEDDKFVVEATVLDFPPYGPVAIPMEYLQRFCMQPWEDILQVWEDEASLLQALEVGFPDDIIIDAFRNEPGLLSDRLRSKMQQADMAARAGALGVPGTAPAVPDPAPASAPNATVPGNAFPVNVPSSTGSPAPSQVHPTQTSPTEERPPWEGTGNLAPGINIPDPAPGASVSPGAPSAPPAPPGSQPDGTAPQGMDEMLSALQNANPQGSGESTPGA